MDIKPPVHAGLFGTDKSTVQEIADGAKSLLAIQFNPAEIAAITTVIGMFLKVMGIQGLSVVMQMLLQLQQSYAAQSAGSATTAVAPTPAPQPSATVATK